MSRDDTGTNLLTPFACTYGERKTLVGKQFLLFLLQTQNYLASSLHNKRQSHPTAAQNAGKAEQKEMLVTFKVKDMHTYESQT